MAPIPATLHNAMMSDDWDASVALRLASLALDRGRLADDSATGLAVRGALLIDLALRGRIIESKDEIQFDTGPTGFAPADRLVAKGAPSLSELLHKGAVDQKDLATEHLRRGSWSLRRRWLGQRYIDHRADQTSTDEQALESTLCKDWTAADAALAALGSVLGLLSSPRSLPTEELLALTGSARWLVEVVVAEINQSIVSGRSMEGAFMWDGKR